MDQMERLNEKMEGKKCTDRCKGVYGSDGKDQCLDQMKRKKYMQGMEQMV